MAFISEVKRDLEFYRNLFALLKVLKGIAISQFQMFEKQVRTFDQFSHVVEGFLAGIDLRAMRHPFVRPATAVTGVVAVTSDAGLLGGLNMRVMNIAFDQLQKEPGVLIVVGEKGKVYAAERGLEIVSFEGIKEESIPQQSLALRNYVIKSVLSGTFGQVKIIYPRAYSLLVQRVEMITPLPYGNIQKGDQQFINLDDFIMESYIERIVEYLVFLWLGKIMYEVFSVSRLSEYAARFTHLEDCTTKLEELEQKLTFKYFKLRHEITDRGMRELFAARSLFSHK